jgi:hypothetical protein
MAPDATKGLSNAGQAKPPKGTMRFKVDGVAMEASENQVQCMLVGMGPSMAQGVITGRKSPGFLLTYTFIAAPVVGDVPEKKGSTPILGANFIKDGVSYDSMPNGKASLKVAKMTKDGNNIYVSVTFSATLQSADGKKLTISEGLCESAYL